MSKLNCLMYADDVILVSESADGLQTCLTKLGKYCDQWGLEVNIKKSKSLIFNNTGKLEPTSFIYKNSKLDNVKKYNY